MTDARKFASEAERLIRTGAGCLCPPPAPAAAPPTFTAPDGVVGVIAVGLPEDDTADLEREAFKREAE